MSCYSLPFDLLKPSHSILMTLDSICSLAPGNAYVKNIDGEYLWCNQNQAQALSMQKPGLILGKSVYDLCEQSTAAILSFNDNVTIEAREEKQFIEHAQFYNGRMVTVISAKKPLLNRDGEVIGIFGSSFMIPQMSMEDKINLLIKQGLAPKEAKSIYHFVNGETSKEIAKRFNLSFRTIEKYIENVRIKLNINKRSQLFEFINSIFKSNF